MKAASLIAYRPQRLVVSPASPELGGAVTVTGVEKVGNSGAPEGFSPNGHWVAALPQEYGVEGGKLFLIQSEARSPRVGN